MPGHLIIGYTVDYLEKKRVWYGEMVLTLQGFIEGCFGRQNRYHTTAHSSGRKLGKCRCESRASDDVSRCALLLLVRPRLGLNGRQSLKPQPTTSKA